MVRQADDDYCVKLFLLWFDIIWFESKTNARTVFHAVKTEQTLSVLVYLGQIIKFDYG